MGLQGRVRILNDRKLKEERKEEMKKGRENNRREKKWSKGRGKVDSGSKARWCLLHEAVELRRCL